MLTTDPFPEIFGAVPAWIEKVFAWTPAETAAACEDTADLIAGGGDELLYGASKPVRRRKNPGSGPPEPTVEVIADAVARGLGILAHAPGGVTALHRHWCVTPHDGCPGPGAGRLYTVGSQAGSGAFYTPRHLAEEVTNGALEALVYQPGPLQTDDEAEWRLRPSAEIIALTVGDIAVGTGAFPVAAVRYLADRVTEAWAAEGVTGDLTAARRAVLRCVHGADINEPAAELAKVALWLVTFDRTQPHPPLDRQFTVGDSLLGTINLEQLAWLHLDAERGKTLHAKDPARVAFPRHLATCVTVATRRLLQVKQHQGDRPAVEALILRTTVDILTEVGKPLGDLAVGASLASGCKKRAWDRLSMEAAHLAAAAWTHPAPVDWSPVPLTMPVVYASDSAVLDIAHIADPTTDHLPTWGLRDEMPRTWFMCGRLADLGDTVYTRTAAGEVCGNCQAQVTQVNAMLASYLRAAADGLRAAVADAGEVAA